VPVLCNLSIFMLELQKGRRVVMRASGVLSVATGSVGLSRHLYSIFGTLEASTIQFVEEVSSSE